MLFVVIGGAALWIEEEITRAQALEDGEGFTVCYLHNDPLDVLARVALFLTCCYSIALVIERWRTLAGARRQSSRFLPAVSEALYHGRLEEAAAVSARYAESPLARVVAAGLQNSSPADSPALRYSAGARHLALVSETARIKQHLWQLGALGSSVPLAGVLFAAHKMTDVCFAMAESGGSGLGWPAARLGEVLRFLTINVLIGVAAIWTHKQLSSRAEEICFETDRLSLAIIDRFLHLDTVEGAAPSQPNNSTRELDPYKTGGAEGARRLITSPLSVKIPAREE